MTESNIGRRLAIILDNRVMSAPTIQSRITDNGQITGVSRDEVNDLSLILQSGRAAREPDLPRRAHDRAEPRRRLDSLGRRRLDRRPRADRRCSC